MRTIPGSDARAIRRRFTHNMLRAFALWIALTALGLSIGMAGYAYFEGMPTIDAFENAAMILSGMGPVTELRSDAGKIFAGCYAILSGLIVVVGAGFILGPVFHHVLHRFHLEKRTED